MGMDFSAKTKGGVALKTSVIPAVSFREWVFRSRLAKGMTQEQFSAATGLDVATLGRWENGAVVPRQESVEKLAAVLEVSVSDIYGIIAASPELAQDARYKRQTKGKARS